MATSEQIESAVARGRAPVGVEHMTAGHLLAMPAQDRLRAALERDLARRMNARLANQHGCSGLCDRPEHARDVAAGVQVLEVLGLRIGGAS